MSRCQLNVAIDKAGFLRRIEMAHQPKKVASTVAQIGDCTPELGVEKVALDFSMPDMNGRVRRLSDCADERICCSPFPQNVLRAVVPTISQRYATNEAFSKKLIPK